MANKETTGITRLLQHAYALHVSEIEYKLRVCKGERAAITERENVLLDELNAVNDRIRALGREASNP